ncbi:MAG: type IV toxin-antitoxin system AbiEi family antitoxin [Thermoleophilia bacterium]|jgi:hypothetical protein
MLSEKDIIERIKLDAQALIPVDWARLEIDKTFHRPASVKADLIFKLSTNNESVHMLAEVIARSARAVFMNKIDQVRKSANLCGALPLIVAPYLNAEERSLCHDHQVFFLDLSGNQWISFEGFLIEREGFVNQFPETRGERNPFADKASLIIRELIANYGEMRGVRELAELLNLSPGFVSKIAAELEERSYVLKSLDGLRLINPKELITDWVSHYNIRNNRQQRYFLPVISTEEVLKRIRELDLPESGYALSVQAGASLIHRYAAYDVVHIYVSDDEMQNRFLKPLQLQSVERGENVILMKPKYINSVFYGSRKKSGLNVVSDLQLYLDLYHYPKRGREQAEKIYELNLAPKFKD